MSNSRSPELQNKFKGNLGKIKLFFLILKNWGDGSVGTVLTVETQRPESDPHNPSKNIECGDVCW